MNHDQMTCILLGAWMLVPYPATSQTNAYPPRMDGAKVEVYKTVGDVKLNLYIFEPKGHSPADRTPAIVFFFGGGWRSGTPQQFEPQCRYLASRGMVAVAADYRVASRNQVKVIECVRDAKSAVRWIRENASRLGIDPSRLAAGGGSAGGHIAAATGVVPGLDEPGENLAISSRPNALVLFNPVLVVAPVPASLLSDRELQGGFQQLLRSEVFAGVDAMSVSPYHHISKGAPPTIIFHGRADSTVPYATADLFANRMIAEGARCVLVGFDGENHGFFNFGRDGNKAYTQTLRKADEFLGSLHYLAGQPALP
jgi:acetyl esterase/lipase